MHLLLLCWFKSREPLEVPSALLRLHSTLICSSCLHYDRISRILRKETCSIPNPDSACTLPPSIRFLCKPRLCALLATTIHLHLLLQIRLLSFNAHRIHRLGTRMHGDSTRQNGTLRSFDRFQLSTEPRRIDDISGSNHIWMLRSFSNNHEGSL